MTERRGEPMSATLSDDRERVRLIKGAWSIEFPVSNLARWLKFYRDLRDRRSGQFAGFYSDDVRALEAVQREVRDGG